MPPIISYAGQTNRTQVNVVEQPPFLRSDQKPLKWWAEGGLVYCIDPNRPDKKPTYLQPVEALQRVATGIKIYVKDVKQNPKDYVVTQAMLATFFNDFKIKVFDVALEQDAAGGDLISKMSEEYHRNKKIAMREAQAEAVKAHEKRTKIFISPKAAEPS
jgi:hypothetical protein